jgi:trimethylamine--corrinoid protein Co-methyltransferase
MTTTYATFLTGDDLRQVHEASLEILERVGMLVRNEKAHALFARHGCLTQAGSPLVKFPRRVIEEFRASMPPTFTFHARDPRFDRTLPKDAPVIITGSSAPNLIDPVTGQERRATSEDIARIARLVNELPGYDVFSISTLAEDAPPGYYSLARLMPTLKNCLKPLRISSLDEEDAGRTLRLGALVAGSEAAYRDHPFITHHTCPVVSPLTFDVDSTEMLLYYVERGYPYYGSIVPNAGLTSPMSLPATLAQGNAEFLAYAALTEMVKPGSPLIYSTLPTVADMRTGAYAPGGIECAMLHMGFAQMARFYNVPCGGYIGLTNSKVNDAQAGYETGMSVVAGLLGGVGMFNMSGLLDSLLAFDFAKAVIDDEIAMMLRRLGRGFEFAPEEMALDVLAEVGPGGTFMFHEHTVEHMRSTNYVPTLADRDPREKWAENGGLDTQARAMQRVRQILTREYDSCLAAEAEARIRAEFKDMVRGDCLPPAEWAK